MRILSGFQELWQTGSAWNTGAPLAAEIAAGERALLRELDGASAPPAEAARAFIVDRQHQSYSLITGLGVLADVYKAGALAVTSIT